MDRKIYVVFSATPYKMGKFIRRITRQHYNHVSIALDDRLKTMYSFARHYEDTPLYGGFVKEDYIRYYYKNRSSEICICELSLTEEQYTEVKQYIDNMEFEHTKYLYNTFSAIFTLVGKRIPIEKSYTCTEFVVQVLSLFHEDITADKFYSIHQLRELLKSKIVFLGQMDEIIYDHVVKDKEFMKKHNVLGRMILTMKLFRELTIRFWVRVCYGVR